MSVLGELRTLTKRPGRGRVKHRDNRAGYLFLLPWFAGLLLITAVPMVASLYLSFTRFNLLQPPEFTGTANFARILGDDRLWKSLAVTFEYVFVSVPIQLALALVLAVVLDKGVRGLAIYRSVYYLPSLIGGGPAIAILWKQVFGSDGLVNYALEFFGIQGQSWVANPSTALSTLVTLNVWTFGAPMVIFLAGLRQIPAEYLEAAKVDGAGSVRRFWSIIVPLLTPMIFFNFVLQIIHAFQSFTQAFIVSGGTGGPADSTLFYTLYLYLQGFGNLQMGYASALAWLLLVIVAVFTAVNFFLAKYWVFYDD
ncbi:carbohydrate ABC transporter permease [Dactylosporangium sp. CA-233914]|uniref:carbohydrate ABC transporter permease n=1 Tax=Dactylosporangium sp. CA-233914 TaxID=3239934 RepID=UPI003D8A9648